GSSQPLAASAWYRFTPAHDEKVVLGGTTASFGAVALTVYTGNSLGALTQVAGSTGIAGGAPGSNFVMPVVLSAVAATTYSTRLGFTFVSPFADNRFPSGVEDPIVFDGQEPAANANGWNHTDVTLNWHCSPLFLASTFVVPVSQTLTVEGANQSATGT